MKKQVKPTRPQPKVEPDCAYVIPPNRDLSILHNHHETRRVVPKEKGELNA
jgi:hypothetical protein